MISALYPLASERLIYCLTNSPNVVQWLPRFGHGSVYSPAPLSPMRPRHAALLTPPSPTPAFLQNVANSNHCHTSEKSPVTPIIATDPKMRSCKSCVCHTCDPLPRPQLGGCRVQPAQHIQIGKEVKITQLTGHRISTLP